MKRRIGIVWNSNLFNNNMENFKLDLTKLTPVAEEDRVMGNWYICTNDIGHCAPLMRRWHSGDYSMDSYGKINKSWEYSLWFAIPPNLPGFPKAELPDEFELKQGEWEYTNKEGEFVSLPMNLRFRRKPKLVPTLPELTIPSGTVEERRKRLQEELEMLG